MLHKDVGTPLITIINAASPKEMDEVEDDDGAEADGFEGTRCMNSGGGRASSSGPDIAAAPRAQGGCDDCDSTLDEEPSPAVLRALRAHQDRKLRREEAALNASRGVKPACRCEESSSSSVRSELQACAALAQQMDEEDELPPVGSRTGRFAKGVELSTSSPRSPGSERPHGHSNELD